VYESVSGKPPFAAAQGMRILWAHLQEIPPDPVASGAKVSPEFSQTILVALEKDPTKRPQTAGEYARRLAEAAGVSGGGA